MQRKLKSVTSSQICTHGEHVKILPKSRTVSKGKHTEIETETKRTRSQERVQSNNTKRLKYIESKQQLPHVARIVISDRVKFRAPQRKRSNQLYQENDEPSY